VSWWSIQVDFDAYNDEGKKFRARAMRQVRRNVRFGACLPGQFVVIP
jgi:hypothetical protein